MFKRRGYKVVTLTEALKDPGQCSAEDYVGRGGFSWIHRWSKAKACLARASPEPPAWAQQGFRSTAALIQRIGNQAATAICLR